MEFKIINPKDFKKQMVSISRKNDLIYTVKVLFGTASVKAYKTASKIPNSAVEDSPMFWKGYWKKGKFYPFSEKRINGYAQNRNPRHNKRFLIFGGG